MGQPNPDIGFYGSKNEQPVHEVYINSFQIGKYEVTQKEYESITGNNPSNNMGEEYPVTYVSWYDAVKYCNKRSKAEDLQPCYEIIKNFSDSAKKEWNRTNISVKCDFSADGYRLPTEAEWEYAAKGGQKSKNYIYSGSNKIERIAWFSKNSNYKPHPVGKKKSNELGLYDMSGNVREWCWDLYNFKYYSISALVNPKEREIGSPWVVRGGGFTDIAENCRSTKRFDKFLKTDHRKDYSNPVIKSSIFGFRVVRRGNIYFLKEKYDFYLKSNEKIIGKINAETDLINSEIRYKLLGPGSENFYINEKSGEISLGKKHTINLQKSFFCSLILEGFVPQSRHSAFSVVTISNIISPEMVFVKGGEFEMGQPNPTLGECQSSRDEQPVHTVILDSFYIGKYEVTQSEYGSIMGFNPSHIKGINKPAESISWIDVLKYCNKLSETEGLEPCFTVTVKDSSEKDIFGDYDYYVEWDSTANGYRLPTEAEWEYAAKGGQKSKDYIYSGSNDLDEIAWHWRNSGDKYLTTEYDERKKIKNNFQTHKVGQKKPNELGIYDMSGNVWEWCWDTYYSSFYRKSPLRNPINSEDHSFKVVRGGCFLNFEDGNIFRNTDRLPADYNHKAEGLGFRLVRNRNN